MTNDGLLVRAGTTIVSTETGLAVLAVFRWPVGGGVFVLTAPFIEPRPCQLYALLSVLEAMVKCDPDDDL
jgi:hypothetical protein